MLMFFGKQICFLKWKSKCDRMTVFCYGESNSSYQCNPDKRFRLGAPQKKDNQTVKYANC